ncbi:MAG: hemolysin family protein [Phycisphaerae bacterium]|jgi:putative hemolysin
MIWVALVLLLLSSATVSASETALFGLGRQALHRFANSPSRWGHRAYRLMQSPHETLMTVLMANTAVNVAIFAVSFFALRGLADAPAGLLAVYGALVPVTVIIFGEMTPKALALSGAERCAPWAAAVIGGLRPVLRPIQWVLSALLVEPITRLLAPRSHGVDVVTTEELKLLVEHSARDGVINSTENEMLQAVVALGEISVRDVMTPRVDIRWIPADAERETVLRAFSESGRRRLPVCGRDLDRIAGVLYARDVYLNPDAPVQAIMRKAHFVPEQVNLMQLLTHFRDHGNQMAMVVDEFGGTAGVVTNGDVVKWIVGELPDSEVPRTESLVEQIDENTYRVPGNLSVRVWADRLGVGEAARHIDTVAGLILSKLGHVPHEGDMVRVRNLMLSVDRVRQRRIERVVVRRVVNGASGEVSES